MTREEAIRVLEEEAEYLYQDDRPYNREAFDMAIEALTDRLSGEFEICGTSNGLNGTMYYKCSLCGTPVDPSDKFCRGCGARMKAR